MKFDEENLGKAWKKLIEARCDPDALKSALYYAAVVLRSAYELPKQFDAFFRAKQEALVQLTKLKKALASLTVPSFRGQAIADHMFRIYGVTKKQVNFFQRFPSQLQRFEDILEFIDFTPERAARKTFSDIASGEVLLHLYVEETTGKLFASETAILLKAGAQAYDVEHGPSYEVEAVNRGRYRRWFRARKGSDYRELKTLVRGIKHDGHRFLTNFLSAQVMTASLCFGAYKKS